MSLRTRRALAASAAAALLLTPVATFVWKTDPAVYFVDREFPAGQSAYVMMRPAGLLAFVLLWIQVVLGSHGPAVSRFLGLRTLVPLHRSLGATTLLFLLLHPILFAWAAKLRTGKPLLATFFPDPTENYWQQMLFFGAVALGLLLLGILASTVGRRFLGRAWRGVHAVNYAGFLLSFFHCISIGSETRVQPVFVLYWVLGTSGGALLLARIAGLIVRRRGGAATPLLPLPARGD